MSGYLSAGDSGDAKPLPYEIEYLLFTENDREVGRKLLENRIISAGYLLRFLEQERTGSFQAGYFLRNFPEDTVVTQPEKTPGGLLPAYDEYCGHFERTTDSFYPGMARVHKALKHLLKIDNIGDNK